MTDDTELLVNCSNRQRAERSLDVAAQEARLAQVIVSRDTTARERARRDALLRLRACAMADRVVADLLTVLGA